MLNPNAAAFAPERPYFSCWRMRAVATRSLPPERSDRRRKNSTTRLRSLMLSFGPENVPMLATLSLTCCSREHEVVDSGTVGADVRTDASVGAGLPAEAEPQRAVVTAPPLASRYGGTAHAEQTRRHAGLRSEPPGPD